MSFEGSSERRGWSLLEKGHGEHNLGNLIGMESGLQDGEARPQRGGEGLECQGRGSGRLGALKEGHRAGVHAVARPPG